MARQERHHSVTMQMVAAASHPGTGMGKATTGTEDQQIFKAALTQSSSIRTSAPLLPGNPTETPLLSDDDDERGGNKTSELQHQCLMHVQEKS